MWCQFDAAVGDHAKTHALAEKLNIPVYAAAGLLALLWAWAVSAAPDGNLSPFRARYIERTCKWDGANGALIEALRESGFLDGSYDDDTLRLHDWELYGGKLLRNREEAAKRKQKSRDAQKEQTHAVTVTRDCHSDNLCDCHATYNIHKTIDNIPSNIPPSIPPQGEVCAPSGGDEPTKSTRIHRQKAGDPVMDARFDRFWDAYPLRVAKQAARKAFAKLAPDDARLSVMLEALERQRGSPEWTKDGGRYVPHASTWLNGARWEDEAARPEPPKPKRRELTPIDLSQY